MHVALKPELARFIEEEVKSGRYSSADDAINDAVGRLRTEQELLAGEIDDEDLAAIEDGLAQVDRGEVRSWEEVRAEFLQKIRPE